MFFALTVQVYCESFQAVVDARTSRAVKTCLGLARSMGLPLLAPAWRLSETIFVAADLSICRNFIPNHYKIWEGDICRHKEDFTIHFQAIVRTAFCVSMIFLHQQRALLRVRWDYVRTNGYVFHVSTDIFLPNFVMIGNKVFANAEIYCGKDYRGKALCRNEEQRSPASC